MLEDLESHGPVRPPPADHSSDRSVYQISPPAAYHLANSRYGGINFQRGSERLNPRLTEATIQSRPGGPVERVNRAVPYEYDSAVESNIRRKDFHGVPLPIRDSTKDFEGPTRFASHRPGDMLPYTNSTWGQAIQHESHRFGLTNALWPIENRDSRLATYQPPLSDQDPRKISRVYADPRQFDLAYKIENRRDKVEPFRSDIQRRRKLGRSSKSRRALSGAF